MRNATRRQVLIQLRDGEKTAGELAKSLDCPPPTLSHHLASLLAAGLVSVRTQGPRRFYSLEPSRVLDAWDRYLESGQGDRPGKSS